VVRTKKKPAKTTSKGKRSATAKKPTPTASRAKTKPGAAKTTAKRTAKAGSPKTKTTSARKPAKRPAETIATVDPRRTNDRRAGTDRRRKSEPVAVQRRKLKRRTKVNRRRQIDPTTCERDYTPEEVEFMSALESYKRTSGRMFPTCSEVLEVLRKLGYEKRPAQPAENQVEAPAAELVAGSSEPSTGVSVTATSA